MTLADQHPEDIKAAIRKGGVTLTELARRNGYSHAAIHKALHAPWPNVERVIADFLGVPPRALWPSRYRDDGMHRSVAQPRGDHRERRRRRHRQNAA
jgi:Ner family transcriptional regulator